MFQALLPPLAAGVAGAAAVWAISRARWPRWLDHGFQLSATAPIVGLAVAFSGVFAWFGVRHYEAMNSHVTDVALMDQMVWATLHGQFMHTTLQGQGIDNFLAFHVEPIMALISPLYLLAPSAGTLVVLQTVGLGVSAIPVGLWAQKRLGSGVAAVLVALAFLLSPVLANDNDLLFEQIPLAVPFLSFALYFQLQRRWKPFAVCLLLALGVREEVAFIAMGMGLYALLVQRERIGWGIVSLGAAWAAVTLGLVIPAFNHGGDVYWASAAYGYLGGTPLAVAAGAVTHPGLVLQHLVAPPRPYFIASLLVPFGLLPLAGWRVSWLALPTLAYLLLGDGKFDPNSWYPSPMLPFLAFGAIEGIAVLRQRIPAHVSAAYLAGTAALSFHLFGAGPGSVTYSPEAYATTAHSLAARALAASIPRRLGVSATPQLIAHVSQRMEVSIFPELLVPQAVFAIDFKGWRGWHGYPAIFNDYDQALRRVLHDPAYGDFYQGDGLLLLKRGDFPAPAGHPMSVLLGGNVQFLGYDAPDSVAAGQPLTIHLRWRTSVQLDQAYTVSVQLVNDANAKAVQQDSWPWDGYFPTLEWPPGREIDDPHTLALPLSLPPGQYRLFVSMYALAGGQAQPLPTGGGESGITVGPLTVAPATP